MEKEDSFLVLLSHHQVSKIRHMFYFMVKRVTSTQSVPYPRPCALSWEDAKEAKKKKKRFDFHGLTHIQTLLSNKEAGWGRRGKALTEMQSPMEQGKCSI